MKNSILVDIHRFSFADNAIFVAYGGELIFDVKIPVQELGGQRGGGTYFRENTVLESLLDRT